MLFSHKLEGLGQQPQNTLWTRLVFTHSCRPCALSWAFEYFWHLFSQIRGVSSWILICAWSCSYSHLFPGVCEGGSITAVLSKLIFARRVPFCTYIVLHLDWNRLYPVSLSKGSGSEECTPEVCWREAAEPDTPVCMMKLFLCVSVDCECFVSHFSLVSSSF